MTTSNKSEKKYSAPKLIQYGEMVKLTATGSGTQAENSGQQVPTRHP